MAARSQGSWDLALPSPWVFFVASLLALAGAWGSGRRAKVSSAAKSLPVLAAELGRAVTGEKVGFLQNPVRLQLPLSSET